MLKYKKLFFLIIIFITNTIFKSHKPNCLDNLNILIQEKFIASLYSNELIIFYKDERIKILKKNNMNRLHSILKENKSNNFYVFDAKIGKTSSLLYSKYKPICVYTFSLTEEIIKIFRKYDVKYITEIVSNKNQNTYPEDKLLHNVDDIKNIDNFFNKKK